VRRAAALVAGTLVLAMLGSPASAPAGTARPRASLTTIELNVMCVSCREPLAVAQSPQAMAERNFIRGLIGQGMTQNQIMKVLVAQYGAAVLGRPPAHGFNLTVYILPPALLALGGAILLFTLPRWRRRTRSAALAEPPPAELTPPDSARLDAELAAFDR
jgi:cytochrome c-type biogenesis protein CcmH